MKLDQGQSAMYKFRCHPALIEALDDYAEQQSISRSNAIRRAIVALTGFSENIPRKRRSDAMPLCEAHGTQYLECINHKCETPDCRCLMHT